MAHVVFFLLLFVYCCCSVQCCCCLVIVLVPVVWFLLSVLCFLDTDILSKTRIRRDIVFNNSDPNKSQEDMIFMTHPSALSSNRWPPKTKIIFQRQGPMIKCEEARTLPKARVCMIFRQAIATKLPLSEQTQSRWSEGVSADVVISWKILAATFFTALVSPKTCFSGW